MRVAIDAMGGDRAPDAAVDGALRAARRGVEVALVGSRERLEAALSERSSDGLPVEIVHAEEVIGMNERSPAEAVRARKDNSLSVAAGLVRHGEAQAMVTAGHTGAAMIAATFGLGRIRGVQRPALVAPFPAVTGPVALLDVGANAEARPEHLLQFGVMGAAYAEAVLDIARPRVGLLTIGEEPGKGNETVREAGPMMAASELEFVGNIEGQDVPLGRVDVAVTDGFTGNVVLKFAEGIAELVRETLSEEARRDPLSMVGGMLMQPALRRVRRRWNYRRFGGAMLLGVRGMVVIGHGRSDAEAVESMIEVARRGTEHGMVDATARMITRASEAVADG